MKDVEIRQNINIGNIANSLNQLYNNIEAMNEKMNLWFNLLQNNTNKNLYLIHKETKEYIKDLRNEMNLNNHYIKSDIKDLNNKINIQNNKINEELLQILSYKNKSWSHIKRASKYFK